MQSKGRTSQFKLSRALKLEQDQYRLYLIIVMEKLQENETYIRFDISQRKTLQWISTWIKSNSSQGRVTWGKLRWFNLTIVQEDLQEKGFRVASKTKG